MTHEIDLGLRGKVALVTGGTSRRHRQWAGGLHPAARAVHACWSWTQRWRWRVNRCTSQMRACYGAGSRRHSGRGLRAWWTRRCRPGPFPRSITTSASVQAQRCETLEEWNRVTSNLTSMMLASKYAIPAMVDSGGGGAIVNVSSISALRPRGLTAYSTSKGAVMALTRAMAVDHGSQGIRVNCVAPGPVYTPMVSAHGMAPDLRDKRRAASVLGIEGTGWDIGNTVLYLSSSLARYITGQVRVVDVGATRRSQPRIKSEEAAPSKSQARSKTSGKIIKMD